MSEEILKALMQLFAIIAKQDGGVKDSEIDFVENFLTSQLSSDFVEEYLALFYKHVGIKDRNSLHENSEEEVKLTSVKDSVKILGICKKINKTLTQQQKVVVLVRLFELVAADRQFTDQRMAIINTAAEVFNISAEEFESTENFCRKETIEELDIPNILIINDKELELNQAKHIQIEELDKELVILQIKSVDLYFTKYLGSHELVLNGLPIKSNKIYLFANGSAIRFPKGKPVYYSDVVSKYLSDITSAKVTYNVNDLEFRFKNGAIGLRNINMSEEQGRLVGIMGASGAGKTTLLNVLTGNECPSKGEVLINGINLHTEKEKMEGVIGYIPQDDLLIEELTVYENLYFNAKLCFKNMTEEEIKERCEKTLANLGLLDRKDLKVGSPLHKTISGGQRKRLNIALELIREPPILFVDEPTSGLSSRDSENVMDLLRELAMKGKLVFVVIHQPSSEIYKMFDKMVILDTGGYLIYYGNPVDAVTYFKKIDGQLNADVGECPACGNVNPELIFNIIDAQVVDEFGKYTNKRKVTPPEWEKKRELSIISQTDPKYLEKYAEEQARIAKGDEEPQEKARELERLDLKFHEKYKECIEKIKLKDLHETPPKSLDIPGWFQQVKIYFKRDFLAKISNTQYLVLNILEAPALGLILAFLIRYIADPNSSIYIFRENANIPIYIFMSLIVAMFLGLMVSGEEIFKDQKILNREKFLNLSRSTYLVAKIAILFIISAIQSILFVLVANTILSVRGLWFEYWWAMFTIATFSNLVGLILSSTFNSAVTIYIMIPLVMIPQMALGGAMFSFDKLNRAIGSIEGVPPICEFIATRWVYEGLMVRQFKDNEYQKKFYDIHQQVSLGAYKTTDYIPELIDRVEYCSSTKLQDLTSTEEIEDYKWKLALLKNELSKETKRVPDIEFNYVEELTPEKFTPEVGINTKEYIEKLRNYYENMQTVATQKKNAIVDYWNEKSPNSHNRLKDAYQNEAVDDIVWNTYTKSHIKAYKDHLIQMIDPIYEIPWANNIFDYRAQFYSPVKYFLGHEFNTFWFNMWVVWLMTAFCYVALYYDWLKRSMEFFPEITNNAMKKLSAFLGKFTKKGASETDKKE
ncbi:MAG: ATP-binding cassette domain-containing protein [Salinivirgaceae bacterium]|nr:ATP-binding cassette domain-containing protein [Salinivirgaceae bacterium]